MYCNNCNSEIENNSKFCPVCGKPVSSTQNSQNENPQSQMPPLPKQEDFSGGSPENTNNAPIKKKGKKLKVILPIAAVLILAAIVVWIFFPKIERAVMGEAEYYLYNEYKNISVLADAGDISQLRHPSTYSADSVLSGEIDLYGTVIDEISIESNVNYDMDAGVTSVNSKMLADGDEIGDLNIGYTDGRFVFTSDLSLDNLVMDAESFSSLFSDETTSDSQDGESSSSNEANTKSYSELIEEISEVKGDLLKIGKKVLDENIDESNITELTTTYNSENVTKVTFTFTGEEFDAMMASLFEKAEENENVYNCVCDLLSFAVPYFYDYSADGYSSADLFDDMYNDFNEIGVFESAFETLVLSVFYDGNGNIVCRNVTVTSDGDNYSVNIESDIDDDTCSVCVLYLYNGKSQWTVDYDKYFSNGKMNIQFEWSDNYDKYEFIANDICVQEVNGVSTIFGNADFSIGDGFETYFNLRLNAGEENGIYNISVALEGSDASGDLSIRTVFSQSADTSSVYVPENNITDIEEFFDSWFSSIGSRIEDVIDEIYYDDYYDYDM